MLLYIKKKLFNQHGIEDVLNKERKIIALSAKKEIEVKQKIQYMSFVDMSVNRQESFLEVSNKVPLLTDTINKIK